MSFTLVVGLAGRQARSQKTEGLALSDPQSFEVWAAMMAPREEKRTTVDAGDRLAQSLLT